MKYSWFEKSIDQKKPLSHIIFFLVALLLVLTGYMQKRISGSFTGMTGVFFLVFFQIEIFIFIAGKIFSRMKPGITGKELTRVVLLRFLLFMVVCFIAAFLIFMAYKIVRAILSGTDISGVFNDFLVHDSGRWMRTTITGLASGAVIFIIVLWQDALAREQKLREEKLIFQNETLRNQVNPHFLFNSLNTISSLITTQPETAEIFVSNLASFYRYILENSQKERISLKSELEFLLGFFSLHKIRDAGKIILNLDVEGADNYHILPVSLQILVENALKHNIATREAPLRVDIYLEDEYLVIRNNIQRKASQIRSTGIGLVNLAERIRLSQKKELIVEETKTDFIVKVPLF